MGRDGEGMRRSRGVGLEGRGAGAAWGERRPTRRGGDWGGVRGRVGTGEGRSGGEGVRPGWGIVRGQRRGGES